MTTWLIVPVLIAEKMNVDKQFTEDMQIAYGSFGIAWRLLDDIRDMQIDRIRGARSAIYACLPPEKKDIWEHPSDEKKDGGLQTAESILDCIMENRIIGRLEKRIRDELASAAAIAKGCNMGGLATELISLSTPMNQGKR